ncbi:MAG: selenocysteine-specific translation elongation factor [Candidatus Velthaea sp.]
MHIIGTAGHVDHGKSSLVRTLTGVDPDRWIEERVRGMTLDLGFAPLRFPDGIEAGIVDVPGHERFLHNMLAGAAGMELLLLVVAANEGPAAQTLEHLAILGYLNVRRTIVVLSKIDLVDEEERTLARALVSDAIRDTVAAGAPIVGVSTRTGEGIEQLRAEIHAALVALPPRAPEAPPFLPIDRVFALPGHGTIVTGTLMQGRIAAGETLVLQPSGREVRVRSLQVFGAKHDAVSGGMRVAANLPGVEVADIARGEVLAAPEFGATASVHVRFRALAGTLATLRRRTPVRAYFGSAEILGTLALDDRDAAGGETGATLFLRKPTVTFAGQTFVVRRLSPKTLLGGGTVDAAGAEPAAADDLRDAPDFTAILSALRAGGLQPKTPAELAAAANVREARAAVVLDELVAGGRVVLVQRPAAYVDVDAAAALFARIEVSMRARQHEHPWALGVTSLALARESAVPEPLLLRLLGALVEDGRLAHRAGYYATLDFAPSLSAEQRAFFERFAPVDPGQPAVPASLDVLVSEMRRAKIPGLSQAFDTLVATGALVKVGGDVYRGTQIAEIRARLEAALRREKQITVAGFRDAIGSSRKYAVPLMEWFDASGVTLRTGDLRVLRAPAPNSS